MFNIGDTVKFGEEVWQVIRYHKVARVYEIMFRNCKTGNHKSVPISQLERYVEAKK